MEQPYDRAWDVRMDGRLKGAMEFDRIKWLLVDLPFLILGTDAITCVELEMASMRLRTCDRKKMIVLRNFVTLKLSIAGPEVL